MRPISVYRDLVNGLAMVKQASARANLEIGVLDAERADLIDRAAQRVIDGEFHDQFVVGVVQGGAGTSTNMNANEVITNIALELAGRPKGDYAYLSPIDHTNRSQSTNDVYPTAVKVGLSLDLMTLLEELDLLRQSFLAKAVEFHDVLKIGRTQLQDAVPMTLGQEFHGFATTLGYDHQRLTENASLLYEINMGATAIGTGITTHAGYAPAVLRHLREITGIDLATADDLVEATSDTGSFMSFSASLMRNAI
jgi:aspartate ammonia-lyase